MNLSPNQILRLAPNKVDYLIPGGEMINEFLGEGPGRGCVPRCGSPPW